jgi:hypothetical protein
MSSLEDEVRAALHAEGERLRPLRPLRLPPPGTRYGLRPRPAGGARRAWPAGRLAGWLLPALAAAVVVLIAVGLVTAKAIRDEDAVTPARPAPTTSTGIPRYYVSLTGLTDVNNATTLVVGDARTGMRLATIRAPKGAVFVGTAPAAAADNRTFIVGEASQEPPSHPPFATTSPLGWYLLTITPGAQLQVHMTRLPIEVTAADGSVGGTGQSGDMALSADGTRLAVLFTRDGPAVRQALRVYSVSSGQLLHTWWFTPTAASDKQASDLSWEGGDSTVAFAFTWATSHTEIRTLDITAGGTDMQADSHPVWSQYVPVPPGHVYTASTPRLCASPFLTADGQAVVCANSSYSPRDKGTTLVWLAYPVRAPASPRVLGGVPLLPGRQAVAFPSVEWANASGSQVIAMWEAMGPIRNGSSMGTMNLYFGVVGGGTVRKLNTGTFQPAGYDAW